MVQTKNFALLQDYVKSLRAIPSGVFSMGSASGNPYERPVHTVRLSSFRMGANLITVGMWKEYCTSIGREVPKLPGFLIDDHPVDVSWTDVMGKDGKGGFCAWASNLVGFQLSLPTEAQFEYAALGGRSGARYPWGNEFDDRLLWSSVKIKRESTASINRTSNIFVNDYGLRDMAGNVWQWCFDNYGAYSEELQIDPKSPDKPIPNTRCVRGGSWKSDNPDCFRCSFRHEFDPYFWGGSFGFRLTAGRI